jgi:hypothetical protein
VRQGEVSEYTNLLLSNLLRPLRIRLLHKTTPKSVPQRHKHREGIPTSSSSIGWTGCSIGAPFLTLSMLQIKPADWPFSAPLPPAAGVRRTAERAGRSREARVLWDFSGWEIGGIGAGQVEFTQVGSSKNWLNLHPTGWAFTFHDVNLHGPQIFCVLAIGPFAISAGQH